MSVENPQGSVNSPLNGVDIVSQGVSKYFLVGSELEPSVRQGHAALNLRRQGTLWVPADSDSQAFACSAEAVAEVCHANWVARVR
eukprot:1792479-Rhodomonas_salina.3